jgi:hypothetical protein
VKVGTADKYFMKVAIVHKRIRGHTACSAFNADKLYEKKHKYNFWMHFVWNYFTNILAARICMHIRFEISKQQRVHYNIYKEGAYKADPACA